MNEKKMRKYNAQGAFVCFLVDVDPLFRDTQ